MLSRSHGNISFGKVQCKITDMKGESKNLFFKDGEKIDIDRYEDKFVIKNYDKRRFINAKTLSIDLIDHDSFVNYINFAESEDILKIKSITQGGTLVAASPLDNPKGFLYIDEIGKQAEVCLAKIKSTITKIEKGAMLKVSDSLETKIKQNNGTVMVDTDQEVYKTSPSKVTIDNNQGKVISPIENNRNITINEGKPAITEL